MAAVAVVPAAPVAKVSVCRVDVTATTELHDALSYYLYFDPPSGDAGKSYAFDVASDGTHSFNNYIFPVAGSWTVRLRKTSDDSDVATASVTAS